MSWWTTHPSNICARTLPILIWTKSRTYSIPTSFRCLQSQNMHSRIWREVIGKFHATCFHFSAAKSYQYHQHHVRGDVPWLQRYGRLCIEQRRHCRLYQITFNAVDSQGNPGQCGGVSKEPTSAISDHNWRCPVPVRFTLLSKSTLELLRKWATGVLNRWLGVLGSQVRLPQASSSWPARILHFIVSTARFPGKTRTNICLDGQILHCYPLGD